MKNKKIAGIMHDLVNHLDSVIHDTPRGFPEQANTNILKQKDEFDSYCMDFIKKRLPESFDFKRIKEIILTIDHRGIYELNVHLKIKIDEEELSFGRLSPENN